MLERRVRTAKYLVFRTRENPWKQRETGGRKSLSCGGFRVLHLRPLGQLSVSIFVRFSSKKLLKNSLERKQERRQKIFDFEIFCVEEYQGESGGRNSQLLPKFRVSPVMTTSIPLHMMQRHLFYYTPRKNARVWRKAIGKKAKLFAKNEKKQLTISVWCGNIIKLSKANALLAQLDRASGYGPEGRGFESLTACQKSSKSSDFEDFCFS